MILDLYNLLFGFQNAWEVERNIWNNSKDLYFSLTCEATIYNKKCHTYLYYKPTPFMPQQANFAFTMSW